MILRSRFFWTLAASYALVLLLTAAVVGALVDRRLEGALLSDLEETLRDECVLLEPLAVDAFRGEDEAALGALLRGIGQRTGLRITLIRTDGVVIGDSDEEPGSMGDHASRPEVVAARSGELGVSQRFSHTVGYEMIYVAYRVGDAESPLGFVRVSKPLIDVEEELASVRSSLRIGAAIGFLLALGSSLLVARRFTAPVAAMTGVAESLRAGDYQSRVSVDWKGELGILGDTLNRLGDELTSRIAALSREDAQLRAILAGMVEGVVAVDDLDRIAFCNTAARVFLCLGDGELEGRNLWERAAVGDLVELIEEARATGRGAGRELEIVRTEGERVLSAHAGTFEGGGQSGLVIVLHDITDLRRLERVRRDFVANVSHELKTPLTSIKGFVETLLEGALYDESNNERFLRRIDANVERLNHLVSDLLSLAHVEASPDFVTTHSVDWKDVLDGLLPRHEEAIAAKGLTCDIEGAEEGLVVSGDTEAMTQVLDNLLDNAIKYSPGPGEVRINLRVEDSRGILEVADSGIGIPSDELERVFERFYRVDKARSRELGGTGLGLSIVKNLVLKMGGEVRVTSTEGQGACFSVILPLA